MKLLLYLIFILMIFASCKEVFEAPPQSLLQASFYHSETKKTVSSLITVQGVGSDSLWVDEANMTEVLLPLTITDTTRFVIWFDSKSDNITFVHKTTRKYDSMETGFYYEYKLQSVRFTQNRIDSVEIIDSLVTTKWNENIKLYIHPLPVGGN